MRIVLVHAYSRTNSGDGLLVDEAVELARQAFPSADFSLVALDPDSFSEDGLSRVIHPLTGNTQSVGTVQSLSAGFRHLVLQSRPSAVQQLIDSADLVVAVGGGYLRAKHPVEAVKTLLAHRLQLPNRADKTRYIYLSQSIGPFTSGTRALFLSRLRHAAKVVVRDDRSMQLLRGRSNVLRAPDMALLGLPDEWSNDAIVDPRGGGPVGLVARALSGSSARRRRYRDAISELHDSGMEYLVQANARGNNDTDFYRSLGFTGSARLLRDSVRAGASERPSVVVSVRLHGSLQTIRSGVPSVHLSYERKGWGAYDDLGIARYVHNAFDFDARLVKDQVEELREDPSGYWGAVSSSIGSLRDRRADLVALLRSTAESGDSQ
ncbi:polysaccharide pyruvyl transferase WcaK-like protein [Rathayibacter sp. PhB93]|uniref:polysaccharide pyruvyl transferase family protein n=1 Tax=unclassified Rathayibacter TaxID=2609250 RepID=UPI000F4ADDF3|nr:MULTISPECIES: polysaccharide pyruvyl transferase family protein [unclassified Rathayibacter]ROQ06262.1 polysaccharide pyruvyl transferase WcaK-like protein [Rathayibacter sp. PhB93]TDQ14019.1 polysaccharide pyruvyl transferase WcaK-like protein [Rathayibacter sp. PhB1]